MKLTKINHAAFKVSLTLSALLALSGCKITIGDDDINVGGGGSGGTPPVVQGDCKAKTEGVNWAALMTENCEKLSDYNLFANKRNPTANPNEGGIPYDLSTALFTDYASKYRFVFVPEGKVANYSEHEAIDFPVGTVLVKTFAMPKNTSFRDGKETLIETRLLIHRESGWVARPYYWSSKKDAVLAIAGKTIPNMKTNHKGVDLTFSYSVPKATSCTSCHSVVPLLQGADDTRGAVFKPIGPKARFLNKDYDYDGIIANQLTYWEQKGILANVPSNMGAVSKAPVFTDNTDINALTSDQLMDTAKAYLDINCAHCHRSEYTLPEPNYAGPAGGSGLQVEYNRPVEENPGKFGVCKTPVAGGHQDYPNDVIPQDPDNSYLLFRVSTTDQRHRMPELGRSTVHTEGVSLLRAWINNLPAASCTP